MAITSLDWQKAEKLLPCLALGDSIAVGVGHVLAECHTEAKVGISSGRFMQEWRSPVEAKQVLISLGVNDGPAAHTVPNLQALRRTVRAQTVYWLLPAGHERARTAIRFVAAQFGDRLIDTAPFVGSDGLHPTGTGYRTIGAFARAARESDNRIALTVSAKPGFARIAHLPPAQIDAISTRDTRRLFPPDQPIRR